MLAFKILFWLHVLPMLGLMFAMKPGTPMMILILLFGVSWGSLRRHAVFGFGPRALTRLTWHAEGNWTVHDAAGAHEAELLPSSYVHPKILVLNFKFKDGGKTRTRALLGDECEPDLLRRLRARLSVA